MALSEEDLRQLLQRGRESLSVEMKPWQVLSGDPAKEIIAKACMALRNSDGGFLVIGMQDNGTPDDRTQHPNVRAEYHPDVIQQIVSAYATPAIETVVHYVAFGGADRVMIEVPAGVKTPVICKNDLPMQDMGTLKAGGRLKRNAVYIRTLQSNGVVSSSIASPADWPRIMETCFNNREADIGAFIRRQLSGLDIAKTTSALFEVLKISKEPSPIEAADAFLNACYDKYLIQKSNLQTPPPKTGTREITAAIVGDFERPTITQDYLFQLGMARRYSGWPPFVSLLNAGSPHSSLNYDATGVESMEYVNGRFHSLDYSRVDATGRFYYVEALRDDLTGSRIKPGEQLEFVIETSRVTEVVAVILHFAKAMCGTNSDNQLVFACRWRGLAGRYLTSWAHPDRGFVEPRPTTADELTVHATIPISMAIDAIGLQIESMVKPLFRLFGGREFDSSVIQSIVTETLNRRL